MSRRHVNRDNRRAAFRRGRRAERWARFWLALKGYSILALDHRERVGEIDVIARRGGVLAFVEVKARPTLDEARTAISAHQRQRIERAASAYLARHPDLARLDCRFDALLLAPRRRPVHITDAWRPAARF